MSNNTRVLLLLLITAIITFVDIPVSNAAGVQLITSFEGFRSRPYNDAGRLSIGYGSKAEGVGRITHRQAVQLLSIDINRANDAVASVLPYSSGGARDALVSLAYNIGSGAFKRSTLVKVIQSGGSRAAIEAEFLKWVYSGGKIKAGLVARRRAEVAAYFG